MSKLLTINETAERLSLGHKSVRRLVAAGELSGVDVSRPGAKRRTLRVNSESVDLFLSRRTTGNVEAKKRRRTSFDARYEAAVMRLKAKGVL